MLLSTMSQKENLQVEGPLGHVGVEICQVWIIHDRLEGCLPPEPLAELLRERSFPCADVACHQNEMVCHRSQISG